jgi:hypothetical protein
MKQTLKLLVNSSVLAAILVSGMALSADDGRDVGAAVFNDKGELMLPEGFREWVFIGAPLTPHGLNDGVAGFPEFHHVYINPDAFAVYEKTGEFPDGTVIAKELVLLLKGDHKDGSKDAPSGRGYFADKFHGMDVMVKDSKRYPLCGECESCTDRELCSLPRDQCREGNGVQAVLSHTALTRQCLRIKGVGDKYE